MNTIIPELLHQFKSLEAFTDLLTQAQKKPSATTLKGLAGSSINFAIAALVEETQAPLHVIIADEKELAAYQLNDLETLLGDEMVLFYPESYKRAYDIEDTDNANVLMRTEVLNAIRSKKVKAIVTYPNALSEKVISQEEIAEKMLHIKVGEKLDIDFIFDVLIEYDFERDDFVYEPGQFAARGGIIDVFSFANDLPFRIEFQGDKVISIRSFSPDTQLSVKHYDKIDILPNIEKKQKTEIRQSFLEFIPSDSILWIQNTATITQVLSKYFDKAKIAYENLSGQIKHVEPQELFLHENDFLRQSQRFTQIHFGEEANSEPVIRFHTQAQPVFNKNFDILLTELQALKQKNYTTYITAEQPRQIERLYTIFEDLLKKNNPEADVWKENLFTPAYVGLKEGFSNPDLQLAIYTDHQLFERYKRYQLKSNYSKNQAITLKELTDLQPGDYVTHIDHGVGQFAGLEKIDANGKAQEAIKIIFKDGDAIFVSIHSLHKIARFASKDGAAPILNKIGTQAWQNLKSKTKKRVKELAFDLIKLYAERKLEKGFAFSPDNYMQLELEASFIYEDTPDQHKASVDVKADMEKPYPMDRLVCGDVGFGKTEVAIRAAFKAALDGKQVAVLVPTTILALQHFKTFSARLKDFPVTIDYINRFKSTKQQRETIEKLRDGKIDILIGTHKLLGKDIQFKDLGLLIIDEEQKFGVSAKDKLKTIKVNVDTLTLSATPIPRTLQFSLLGARDLSIIRTPPTNRYPVVTEQRGFNEEVIRDAIMYEVQRNGQVFFIHNRVQNITEITGMIQRLCPDVKVRYAHGQMDGKELENIMLDFIEGDFDVLVATSIIESGLDIPNANTMIINNAHNFGLSDLHQMRGRVGRSNKKAFCYLLTPPITLLTNDARRRINALLEFSDLGSGFNIAMKDLDIRGSGDLLGADQSGFINEIGYETYQKILNEALEELKQETFAELFEEELAQKNHQWSTDCQIDTDLEILLPESYIDNIAERLSLYKELDELKNEDDIQKYQARLVDRFGEMPAPAEELMNLIRMRNLAQQLGFEKIILKQNRMICYLISNQQSAYYQSEQFQKILQFLQKPEFKQVEFKQKNEKLSLTFQNVKSVLQALHIFQKID